MRKLFDAGMRVFAERGYHAARVDDIVRAARTSHGTFYLYFANKEDLLRALAVDCADDLAKLADRIGPITPDEQGFGELRAFLAEFVATYRRYGPVIRAWMEDQVADPEIDRLGVKAFMAIAAVTSLVLGAASSERERAIKLREEFISIASHELNTPLTALLLQVQRLTRRSDHEPVTGNAAT